MSEIVSGVVEWLAATGAPNALVVLALLTRPGVWSNMIRSRVSDLLDRFLPAGGSS